MTISKPPYISKTKTPSIPLLPLQKIPLCINSSLPFHSAYSHPTRVRVTFSGPGRTKQSFKDECDINQIMARYQRTGVLDFQNRNAPQYGDCTGVEFQAGLELVMKARRLFAELPSTVRRRFANDPGEFLDFVNDERNRAEAITMGLVRAPEADSTPPGAPPPRRVAQMNP